MHNIVPKRTKDGIAASVWCESHFAPGTHSFSREPSLTSGIGNIGLITVMDQQTHNPSESTFMFIMLPYCHAGDPTVLLRPCQ